MQSTALQTTSGYYLVESLTLDIGIAKGNSKRLQVQIGSHHRGCSDLWAGLLEVQGRQEDEDPPERLQGHRGHRGHQAPPHLALPTLT